MKNLLCEVFDLLFSCSIIGCFGVCFVWLQEKLSDKSTRKINSKNPRGKSSRKIHAEKPGGKEKRKRSVGSADVLAPARNARLLARILQQFRFFAVTSVTQGDKYGGNQ